MTLPDIEALQRAHESLSASERRLRLVLQGGNDGWWDWDLVAHDIVYADRWWAMFGYRPGELPADPDTWRRLLHPDDRAAVEQRLADALTPPGDRFELECRLQHKAGHYVPILARGHIERDARGRAVRLSGSNVDLSGRKAAEQALRESEASQQALFRAMADGVFVAQQHRFVLCNPALPAMLGYGPDEFVGLGFADVVHPESLALWTERFDQRVAGGTEPLRHYEVRFLKKGRQESVWIELRANRFEYHGHPAVLGIVREVTERKQSDAALRAAQQLAQATLDGLTAHVCVLDADGRVVSCNSAWRDFEIAASVTPRIEVGVDYLAVGAGAVQTGSPDAAALAAGLRSVLDGTRARFERVVPLAVPAGHHWFLQRITRTADGSGPARVIVAREQIDEQIEAEQRVENLRQRLSMAIQGAGYGVWEFELDTGRLHWDEQMSLIYGQPPGAFDGSADTWRRHLHPHDRALVDARFAQLIAGEPVQHFVFRILRGSDGALRHIEANGYLQRSADGRPQRLVGMNRDVTAQFDAESALRESEARWKFAIECAGDGVWDWDMASGQVVYSSRWKALLGHDDDEIGDGFDEWRTRVHPDDLPAALAALEDYFQGRSPVYAVEHRMRCRDGGWKWILSRGLVVSRGPDGSPLRMVGQHADLTAQKEAAATQAALEARLREAQKMEAIGTLAGGVAHDFNNVLAGILGNLALATQDVGPQHAALGSLAQIHKAALRARNLVQQILAFSRRQPQTLVNQPLRPLVEETLALLRATVPAAVRLDAELAEQPLHAMADATQMQQVLMNLCTNAWHALQGGSGRIVVGLAAVRVDIAVAQPVGDLEPGDYVHLWVSDDGCGMDAGALARIFDPFYTTKPVGQGTGLGLAVVHGIVAAHGGGIRVASQPGQGSRFDLYLPRVAPGADSGTAAAGPVDETHGHGEHVVYIDDDEIMVMTVEQLLQRAGYRVSCYLDARRAMERLRADPAVVDLVVTDFNMPEVSGLEVARELQRLRPSLPVVISSGYISEELRFEAQRAGVRGLLNKENTVEELRGLVQRLLGAAPAAPPPA